MLNHIQLWGGVPARMIKYRFSEDIIKKLQLLEWWDLPMNKLRNIDFANIENAIKDLALMKEQYEN